MLRGAVKKSIILKDIVQIGGREVNHFKKMKRNDLFDKNWRGRGSQNILSKIEALFLYDLLLNLAQPRDSVSFCLYP